jgi:large subunit ribosomal protein L32
MAVPKRKTSKSKRNKRRTHQKLSPIYVSTCPECNEPTQPHHACPKCGFYRGRLVVKVDTDETK